MFRPFQDPWVSKEKFVAKTKHVVMVDYNPTVNLGFFSDSRFTSLSLPGAVCCAPEPPQFLNVCTDVDESRDSRSGR